MRLIGLFLPCTVALFSIYSLLLPPSNSHSAYVARIFSTASFPMSRFDDTVCTIRFGHIAKEDFDALHQSLVHLDSTLWSSDPMDGAAFEVFPSDASVVSLGSSLCP